jgi:hypothetical protein
MSIILWALAIFAGVNCLYIVAFHAFQYWKTSRKEKDAIREMLTKEDEWRPAGAPTHDFLGNKLRYK